MTLVAERCGHAASRKDPSSGSGQYSYEKTDQRALTPQLAEIVSQWLEHRKIHQWLDFGEGRQKMSASALIFASRSPRNVIRVTFDSNGRPFGVVALANLNRAFGTAMIWGLRPVLRPPVRSNMAIEMRHLLRYGFTELGLNSVYGFVVAGNTLSYSGMCSAGFKEVGRQRKCHVIDGQVKDRILFDITREEFFLGKSPISISGLKSLTKQQDDSK